VNETEVYVEGGQVQKAEQLRSSAQSFALMISEEAAVESGSEKEEGWLDGWVTGDQASE
jgi:hypothetical protein